MSESRSSAKLNVPMPTPRMSQAPYFKGKCVTDFLESLEAHAMVAQVPLDQLPRYILCYSHSSIKHVIESNDLLKGSDWAAMWTFLVDLYGSSNKTLVLTANKL